MAAVVAERECIARAIVEQEAELARLGQQLQQVEADKRAALSEKEADAARLQEANLALEAQAADAQRTANALDACLTEASEKLTVVQCDAAAQAEEFERAGRGSGSRCCQGRCHCQGGG
ncbi:hypothetical protein WJX81_008701 [Elliptochloris bilobata]|uniref:Uncharacterized protein n=1 Tax=Elliptochloris bilobata TaxID=381761 RepID=A0AAW1RIQ7_9CHLO